MNRRDFLMQGSLLAAGFAAGCAPQAPVGVAPTAELPPMPGGTASPGDASVRDIAMRALDAARGAGASYADVRISRNRTQSISTRERQITGLIDNETYGFGVRVLAGGSFGFAASRELTLVEAERVAREAVLQAKSNATLQVSPIVLAPTQAYTGTWRSPIRTDPFDIPVADKVGLLLEANAAALQVNGARFVNSAMLFLREEKTFASTEGTYTEQTIYRSYPVLNVTAVGQGDFQSRQSTDVAPMGLGYEYVLDSDLVGNAPRWAEDAVQKLSAKAVQPGRYDLLLLPTHLWLTVHESIAHPTELDRIMGFEANYAGTSFIYPIDKYLGQFRYGPEFMNVQGERSTPGALSSIGWDDEGVKPDEYLIVKDGVLWDLQTTREQAPLLADWYAKIGQPVRSHGNSYAQSWGDVQFQRMPNINLLPNAERDVSVDELVSDIKDGILIDGSGSFSIDQQRYNAQFGGQVFYEIKNGKRGQMLKDVAYQMRTPEFWAGLDGIGGPSTYWIGGSFNDGKGQPSQSNAVSHGTPASRFRKVNVINTGRRA